MSRKGLTIENKVVGGTIPREFIPAVEKGFKEAVLNGVVAGYPVIDVHVDIVDGSYHDMDSNEMAFKMAAIFALKDCLKKARSILLEPIMKVENVTPEEFQGELSRRRARRSTAWGSADAGRRGLQIRAGRESGWRVMPL